MAYISNKKIREWIDLLSTDGSNTKAQIRRELLKLYTLPKSKYIELPLEDIKELYRCGWSVQAIANQYYVSKLTIKNRLKTMGISIRKKGGSRPLKLKNVEPETIRHLYEDFKPYKTTNEIGRMFNCSGTCIRNFMKRHGIPIRNPHYVGRVYKKGWF